MQKEIHLELSSESAVRIFSLNGQLKVERDLLAGQDQLEVASWSKGLYVIQVQSAYGQYQQKLIIH